MILTSNNLGLCAVAVFACIRLEPPISTTARRSIGLQKGPARSHLAQDNAAVLAANTFGVTTILGETSVKDRILEYEDI